MPHTDRQDTPALVIDNISKTYTQWQRSGRLRDIVKNLLRPEHKTFHALQGISLTVGKGEFVAYAGANGAGKSTTIKILSGIIRPTEGNVSILGMNPASDRVSLMKRVGVLFGQRTELWWDHPVITSFEWKKAVWNIEERIYAKNLQVVTELLDLSGILQTFARELSLGQRLRADLGMLLLHDPEVILLDEPTIGLDILTKRHVIDFLKEINRNSGRTIIVTSHDMDDLEEMAERIVLISKGRIIFDGTFDQLRIFRGASHRIQITTRGLDAHELPHMALVNTRDGVHEYIFADAKGDMRQLFRDLSNWDDITDIEVRKAPIEDVISKIFLEEKKI